MLTGSEKEGQDVMICCVLAIFEQNIANFIQFVAELLADLVQCLGHFTAARYLVDKLAYIAHIFPRQCSIVVVAFVNENGNQNGSSLKSSSILMNSMTLKCVCVPPYLSK